MLTDVQSPYSVSSGGTSMEDLSPRSDWWATEFSNIAAVTLKQIEENEQLLMAADAVERSKRHEKEKGRWWSEGSNTFPIESVMISHKSAIPLIQNHITTTDQYLLAKDMETTLKKLHVIVDSGIAGRSYISSQNSYQTGITHESLNGLLTIIKWCRDEAPSKWFVRNSPLPDNDSHSGMLAAAAAPSPFSPSLRLLRSTLTGLLRKLEDQEQDISGTAAVFEHASMPADTAEEDVLLLLLEPREQVEMMLDQQPQEEEEEEFMSLCSSSSLTAADEEGRQSPLSWMLHADVHPLHEISDVIHTLGIADTFLAPSLGVTDTAVPIIDSSLSSVAARSPPNNLMVPSPQQPPQPPLPPSSYSSSSMRAALGSGFGVATGAAAPATTRIREPSSLSSLSSSSVSSGAAGGGVNKPVWQKSKNSEIERSECNQRCVEYADMLNFFDRAYEDPSWKKRREDDSSLLLN